MANIDGARGGAMGIFRRKPIADIQAETQHGELKRTLGPLNLVLLGIGCIIGTGIFVLTGQAAAQYAGPAIMISFIITGTLCAFVGLCYAELASMLPVSGSAYSYSYASMGEVVAWIMGVLLLLEYGLAASTVAVGWSGYVVKLLTENLHIDIPVALRAAPGVQVLDSAGHVLGTGMVNLPAIIAITAVTTLLVVGVSESATVNNIVVFIKVGVVLMFIAIGAMFIHPANWSPLVPPQDPAPAHGVPNDIWSQIWRAIVATITSDNSTKYGFGGVIHGAAMIFFAYLGFEAVSTAGAESKNPARDMPIGILGSLIICTILYIITSGVLVGIVPYRLLNDPAPIAIAVDRMGPSWSWFAVLVKLGAIAGLSSVMLVLLYGQTRIFYTMSRDGLLPRFLASVHPKFKTPWINTIIVGIGACLASGFMSLKVLSNVTNLGSLTAFAIVCITVIYLRFAQPKLERPFKVPLYPVVPILGVVMCAFLVLSLWSNPDTRNFFIPYILIGVLVYFLYGAWNSNLRKGIHVRGHEAAPMELPHKGD
jgi:APA family basic amino acid/polyamine antiporter